MTDLEHILELTHELGLMKYKNVELVAENKSFRNFLTQMHLHSRPGLTMRGVENMLLTIHALTRPFRDEAQWGEIHGDA